MSRFFLKLMVVAVTLVPVLCSCSIKEDRTDCPVTIHFNPQTINPLSCTGPVRVYAYRTTTLDKTVDTTMKAVMNGFTIRVIKGKIRVCGVCGLDAMKQESGSFIIPYGEDSDPVFVGVEEFETREEDYTVTNPLRKNYAKLSIHKQNLAGVPDLHFRLESDVNGFDAYDFTPTLGKFACEAKLLKDATEDIYVCNLPRQVDNGLKLYVYSGDTLLYDIDLGLYLSYRYDWQKENLDDIDLLFGYTNARLYIKVRDWDIAWNVDYEL